MTNSVCEGEFDSPNKFHYPGWPARLCRDSIAFVMLSNGLLLEMINKDRLPASPPHKFLLLYPDNARRAP
jgi:hypothetical protein